MMISEVDIVFNYGGKWVFSPDLVYCEKLVHLWTSFDPDLLSYKDIRDEFTSRLGFVKVKQLLVVGPSGKYYLVEGDKSIRALLCLLCNKFKVLNFFAVDESESTVFSLHITDCEHSLGSGGEYDLQMVRNIIMRKWRVLAMKGGGL
ncbi:hypothetical protein A4A49_10656 [Nicotiana attenuata]|uniref:PB1-like domain-containing protein n=1 Tax=Nicotiana attenuata TaxID=49451 RepID=A0A1J6IL70_NICAT|nr:hypothetical protein A4A49_10656 [Nicotiana attenuata]